MNGQGQEQQIHLPVNPMIRLQSSKRMYTQFGKNQWAKTYKSFTKEV